MTESLATLKAANEAVTAKEEEKAEFLKAAFSNEFVKDNAAEAAGTTNDKIGTLDASDVNEGDIAEANDSAANVLVAFQDAASANLISGTGNAFNKLTDAQQNARIEAAKIDLQADIDTAKTALKTTEAALKSGTKNLVNTANAKANALADANKAKVIAADATATQEGRVDLLSTSKDAAAGKLDSAVFAFTPNTTTLTDSTITVNATGKDGNSTPANGTGTVDIATIVNGKVTINDSVVTLAKGVYSFKVTILEATPNSGADNKDYTVSITKADLDALVAAAQVEYDAIAAEASAASALKGAIADVLNSQDSTLKLDASKIAADTEYTLTAYSLSTPNKDASVSINYAADEGSTVTAIATDLVNYVGDLASLATAEKTLSDFNEAVTAWQATKTLVNELKALNDALGTKGDAADAGTLYGDVTAATKAITNKTDDKDAPGLGITLGKIGTDNGTAADDLFILDMATSGLSIADFGAEGSDKIFVGTDFTLFNAAEGSKIFDSLGNLSILEAIVIDDGKDTNIYFEKETFGGNSAGTADLVQVTLTGVTGQEVSIDANGFLTIA